MSGYLGPVDNVFVEQEDPSYTHKPLERSSIKIRGGQGSSEVLGVLNFRQGWDQPHFEPGEGVRLHCASIKPPITYLRR